MQATVWSFDNPIGEKTTQDPTTLLSSIKACGRQKNLRRGSRIHTDIIRAGSLEKNISIQAAIIGLYSKCGALAEAQYVFDEFPTKSPLSWNTLIAGYAQHGLSFETLNWFSKMQDEGLPANATTYSCVLKACGSTGSLSKGEQIHNELKELDLLEKDIVLGNALVDMYAKCGAMMKAQHTFDRLCRRNVITWTTLICGYAQHGLNDEALQCFERMQSEDISPNSVTFACLLKACSGIGSVHKGEEIHAEVMKQGLLKDNPILGNALVNMYAKCGAVAKAQELFDELPVRNIVTWTALITAYTQQELGHEALNCFQKMRNAGLVPDAVTFACILKACGSTESLEKGEEIHSEVRKQGYLRNNIVLGNALIDMYAKCGAVNKAQYVFDGLKIRDVISWNTLISGYAQNGYNKEALNCFDRMQNDGVHPDEITFACILKACGGIGSLDKGEEIHVKIRNWDCFENSRMVGNALVDMYAKCGAVAKAEQIFDKLEVRNVVSWTALITGYAQQGEIEKVFDLFSKMINEDEVPDVVTFVAVLSTCSHACLVDEGQIYADIMTSVYFINPTLEHYTCLVDLFSRSGCFEKALTIIQKVQPSDCLPLWLAVLSSCKKWVNVDIGRVVFENVIQLDKNCSPAYICMSNIYVSAGLLSEANRIDNLRMINGVDDGL